MLISDKGNGMVPNFEQIIIVGVMNVGKEIWIGVSCEA